MHAMDDDVNMKHYGALRRAMPVTFLTFAMGYLAIIGFPGFSGFWSKDKIIEVAWDQHWYVGLLALLGAGVTAFYMTRLMLLTFFGERRWPDGVHPHESPRIMTGPLVVLAALSVLGGLLMLGSWIQDWLSPVVGEAPEASGAPPAWAMSALAVVVVAVGVATAWIYIGRRPVAPGVTRYLPVPHVEDVVVPPGLRLTRAAVATDRYAVDGLMSGGPLALAAVAGELRKVQNGYVRSYALSVLGGSLVLVLALLVVNS
jgi:NADH-quinone oxidoreductase subunit L